MEGAFAILLFTLPVLRTLDPLVLRDRFVEEPLVFDLN